MLKQYADPVCNVLRFEAEGVVAAGYLINNRGTDAFAFENNEQTQQPTISPGGDNRETDRF